MTKKTQSQTTKRANETAKLDKPMPKKCVKQNERIQREEKQIAKILQSLK